MDNGVGMLELLFWSSFFCIIYTYIGYPCLLIILSWLRADSVLKVAAADLPFVSVVIAAKNEQTNIAARLNNILDQDYPVEKLDIVVVSDGSTDSTQDEIEKFISVSSHKFSHIKTLYLESPQGKPSALNKGVVLAKGDLVVFADSRQRFSTNAISELVANFSDSRVGCVSGELVFLNGTGSDIQAEMGAYWKYEKFIRKTESQTGSVVGATGAIYAIRKKLYQPLPQNTLLDDVLVPMKISMQGYRVIFENKAHAFDIVSSDVHHEWRRKVRTLAGNWQLFSLCPLLLSPRSNKLFFRFLSHKVMRLFVPFLMVSLLVSSFFSSGTLYTFLFITQLFFYLVALIPLCFQSLNKIPLVKLIHFFCVLNFAALTGFYFWLLGKCDTLWGNSSK